MLPLCYLCASIALTLAKQSFSLPRTDPSPDQFSQHTFEGEQVLRVVPRDHREVQYLKQLEDSIPELDFWKQPYNVDHDVDVRIPSSLVPKIKQLLWDQNMRYQVLIADVQRAVDNEKKSMKRSLRTKRDATGLTKEYLDLNKEDDLKTYSEMFLNNYNSHSEINTWLEKMNSVCGKRCSLHDIGETGEGLVMRVIKIGGKRQRSRPKSAIWIDGGIHGREWISPTTATNIIYKLIMDYSIDRCTKHIAEAYDWYILPVANPDGYEYSRTRNRMWRKNRKVISTPKKPWWTVYYFGSSEKYCYGVDLNRNFGYSWGVVGTSANPCSDVYGGTEAFSEPETQAIQNFTSQLNVNGKLMVYLSLHSYGQYWLYSWGYTRQLPEDHSLLDSVASQAAHAIFTVSKKKTQYIVGPAARTLYASSGASDDWAKGSLGVKYAYTLELPPSDAKAQGNGFLLPITAIPRVINDTWPGIKAMAAGTLQRHRPNHAKHEFCNPDYVR